MTDDRPLRRDVVANRARILAAAEKALREEGMAVDMRAIAAAAGVGIGTLYRHFPTRQHLVQAVTGTDLADLTETGLPEDMPALAALREVFTTMVAHLADNKAMTDVLAAGAPSEADLERCVVHLTRLGQEAVDRARADHTLATDVTASDIVYQLLGLVRIAQLLAGTGPAAITRHVDLALRGLGRT